MTGERAQDQGRQHRRKGRPSAETRSLLAEYQAAMRDELRAILTTVKATKVGLMADAPAELAIPLDDPRRTTLWDRAVKVARELGTAVDETPSTPEPTARRPRSRKRVDYG